MIDVLRRLDPGRDVCRVRLEPAYWVLERDDSETSRSVERSLSKREGGSLLIVQVGLVEDVRRDLSLCEDADSGRLKLETSLSIEEATLALAEVAGLFWQLVGTGVFDREIQTPSTSTPLSSALIPKGISSPSRF